jgi:hypothetical protein
LAIDYFGRSAAFEAAGHGATSPPLSLAILTGRNCTAPPARLFSTTMTTRQGAAPIVRARLKYLLGACPALAAQIERRSALQTTPTQTACDADLISATFGQ